MTQTLEINNDKNYKTQVRHYINAHKIATPLVVLAMMMYFDFWGTSAWIYLALHGSYCGLWMIKEYTFRDKRFEQGLPFPAGMIFVFGMLGMYWIAPYLIISQQMEVNSAWVALCIILVVVGCFYHYVSDAHKHAVLSIKKGLITNGLFARSRNPNYLGEMLIYLGFALMAQHWLALLPLVYWWTFFFRNMLNKDRSMSRYPEFAAWKAQTGLLLPKLF